MTSLVSLIVMMHLASFRQILLKKKKKKIQDQMSSISIEDHLFQNKTMQIIFYL